MYYSLCTYPPPNLNQFIWASSSQPSPFPHPSLQSPESEYSLEEVEEVEHPLGIPFSSFNTKHNTAPLPNPTSHRNIWSQNYNAGLFSSFVVKEPFRETVFPHSAALWKICFHQMTISQCTRKKYFIDFRDWPSSVPLIPGFLASALATSLLSARTLTWVITKGCPNCV